MEKKLHIFNDQSFEWEPVEVQTSLKEEFVKQFPAILPDNYTLEDWGGIGSQPVDENGKPMPFFDTSCMDYW